jgi:hypothetical protein
MKLASKPYNLLLPGIFICLIISVFSGNDTSDFYIHDTVFIVGRSYLFIALAFLFSIFWITYLLSNKILLSRALIWIHIVITLVFFILFPIATYEYMPHYNPTFFDRIKTILSGILVIAFSVSQLLFLFNLIGGAIKKLIRYIL